HRRAQRLELGEIVVGPVLRRETGGKALEEHADLEHVAKRLWGQFDDPRPAPGRDRHETLGRQHSDRLPQWRPAAPALFAELRLAQALVRWDGALDYRLADVSEDRLRQRERRLERVAARPQHWPFPITSLRSFVDIRRFSAFLRRASSAVRSRCIP